MMISTKRAFAFAAILCLALTVAYADLPAFLSGTWNAADATAAAPSSGASVLLADGSVLVIGGDEASGASAAVSRFAGGNYAAAASMNVARKGHTATVLADGRVLVTGGDNGSGATNAAEVYDSATGAWTTLSSSLVEARSGHSATLLNDGTLLLIGGGVAAVEIFNPSTDTFSFAGTLSAARSGHGAALLNDGRVLVAGGSDGTNALASAEFFDPADGTSTAIASMSVARNRTTASPVLDGHVVVIGGNDGANDVGSAEHYDVATNSWEAVNGGTPRSGHVAIVLPNNNNILIAGGTSAGVALASAELFNPWNHSFSATGSMTVARAQASASELAAEGKVLVSGAGSGDIYNFATIRTDKDDYYPGEIVYMTGGGFQPGEQVALHLHEDQTESTIDHPEYTVTADAFGTIGYANYSPTPESLGAHYHLTAVGQTSGLQAQMTFTDSPKVGSVTISGQAPSPVPAGNSATYTVTVKRGGLANSGGAFTANITVTGLPTGSTFAPLAISLASGDPSKTGTLTISTLSSTPVGTTGFSVAATKSDNSGDSATNAGSLAVSAPLDSTPPVITPTVTGTLGMNGWYTSNVGVSWSVTEAESSVSSTTGCGASTVSTDTTGVTFTCQATSAGGTSSNLVTIKRDASAPSAALSVTGGTLGSADWYTTDVTVHTAGTDAISGITSCTLDQQQTTETAGQVFNGSCTNGAGLSTNASSLTIKLDKTGPSAALSVTAGTAGTNGWYTSDVTVHTTGTDAISGGVTCSADQSQTTETTGTAFNGSCTNAAGLSTNAAPLNIKLDKTAPSASLSASGTFGDNGWYVSNVTISATGGDSVSSPVSCTADQSQNTDTSGATFDGSCTNNAGLITNASSLTIKRDATAPTALASASPSANGKGWNNSDVTVTFNGSDSLSGLASCDTPVVLSSEGAEQSASGKCKDNAGNLSLLATASGINIDKTAPAISGSASPVANLAGWNNTNVTVSFSCTDSIGGSGVDSSTVAGALLSSDGAGQSVTNSGSCTDNAGNTAASSTVSGINIDKTKPVISGSALPAANLAGWNNTNVTVSFSCTDDTGSGVNTNTVAGATLSSDGIGLSVTNTGSCTDKAGNTADSSSVAGIKIDKTAPSISAQRDTAANGAGWNNGNVLSSYTASDSGSGLVEAASGSFSFTAEGVGQSHTFTVSDVAGNSASATVSGIKIDKTAPSLAPSVAPNPVLLNGSASGAPNASDGLSGVASSSCPAVPTGAAGSQSISCTATDNAGNSANANATYNVTFAPVGLCMGSAGHQIVQPINVAGDSVFKSGSTVPAKFRVCDANGNSVGAGVINTFLLVGTATGIASAVVESITEPVISTNNQGFRFDTTDKQWIFNINTKGMAGNTTYMFRVALNDGTNIDFIFGLKK